VNSRFRIAALLCFLWILSSQIAVVQAQDGMGEAVRESNQGGSSEFDTRESNTVPNLRPPEGGAEPLNVSRNDFNPFSWFYDFSSWGAGNFIPDVYKENARTAAFATIAAIRLTEPAIAEASLEAMNLSNMFSTGFGSDHKNYAAGLSPHDRATYFNCIREQFEVSSDPLQARIACTPGPSSQAEAAVGVEEIPESRALHPRNDPVLAGINMDCSGNTCSFNIMSALLGEWSPPMLPIPELPEREFIDRYIGGVRVTFTDSNDLLGGSETNYQSIPPLEPQGLYARYMFHLRDIYGALTYLIYGRCMKHNETWNRVSHDWSPWRVYQYELSDIQAIARELSFVNEAEGTVWQNPWQLGAGMGVFPLFPDSFWSRVNSFPNRNASGLMDFLSGSFGFPDMLVENLFAIFIAEEQGEPQNIVTHLNCLNLADTRFELDKIRNPVTGILETTGERAKLYYELAQILALDQLGREIERTGKRLDRASQMHFIHIGAREEHPIRTLALNMLRERIRSSINSTIRSDSRQSELGFDPSDLRKAYQSFIDDLNELLAIRALGFQMEFRDNPGEGALG